MPVTLRLLVGQLSAAAAGAPDSQQRTQLYNGLVDLLNADGEAQPFPWVLFIRECSQKAQAGRSAYIDVMARPDSASTVAALAVATAGHLQVASYRIPVVQITATQPLDTVELVVQQPPLVLGFNGFTAAMLEAAGYTDVSVAAEWRGGSRAPGGAPELSKQFQSVIAWVRPPPDDPQLTNLPDTFQDPSTGATCRIQVRTRLERGLQQYQARQLLAAGSAAAQPSAEQPPLATPGTTADQEMPEAPTPHVPQVPDEEMELEPQAEADPQPQQEQQQNPGALHHQQLRPRQQQRRQPTPQQHQPPERQQQQQHGQAPANRSKGSATKQPTPQQVQRWMADSAVWCTLAEQAQHLLESLDKPWTEQEQLALASAYMLAFERSSQVPPSTEREWLLAHYQLPADSDEYADGLAVETSSQRRYPVRGNRGLPANPWFEAAPGNLPTQPTGAQGRPGRQR